MAEPKIVVSPLPAARSAAPSLCHSLCIQGGVPHTSPHLCCRISQETFLPINWHLVFFDEAHKLKSTKSKGYEAAARIRTPLRYGLTGTAMQARCLLQMATCDASLACGVKDIDTEGLYAMHPQVGGASLACLQLLESLQAGYAQRDWLQPEVHAGHPLTLVARNWWTAHVQAVCRMSTRSCGHCWNSLCPAA